MHAANVKKQFSKKLKELRKKKDLSVLELSRLSGVSRQHIRDLELAVKFATLKTLCKLANAFDEPLWKMVRFGETRCRWN